MQQEASQCSDVFQLVIFQNLASTVPYRRSPSSDSQRHSIYAKNHDLKRLPFPASRKLCQSKNAACSLQHTHSRSHKAIIRQRADMIMTISYIRQKGSSTVISICQHLSKSTISLTRMGTYTEQKITNILNLEEKITTLVPCGSLAVVP